MGKRIADPDTEEANMSITARKTENDGRQWFAVEFTEDAHGVEAGTHQFALCADGSLVDHEGYPVKRDGLCSALRRAFVGA